MLDLDRFVKAQDPVLEEVLGELHAGRKQTHWMWFIFPQLRGLGRSSTSQFYGIEDLAEARSYLEHAVLGPRLEACVEAVLAVSGRSLKEIFDTPDDMKFRSSMTLFAIADGDANLFHGALERYCRGRKDPATLRLLKLTN